MNVTVAYKHEDSLFDDSSDWPLKPAYSEERMKRHNPPLKVGISKSSDGNVRQANYETYKMNI